MTFERLEAGHSHLSVIDININSSFISLSFSVSMIWSANQQIRITTEKHKIDLNLQVPSVLMINIYYETEQKYLE